MSSIIGWVIKKVAPFREIFTVFYIIARAAWIASVIVFMGYIIVALTRLWDWISDLTLMLQGSSIKGAMVGGNDVGAIILSLLDSMGVSLVLETFVPLFISTLSFYLTYSLARITLVWKDKLLDEVRKAGQLGFGGK